MNILKIILKNLKINNFIFTTSKIFKKKFVLKSSEESIKELNKYSNNNNYTAYYENNNVNKKEYDLDIIIPAYNVEKYINKCIYNYCQYNNQSLHHQKKNYQMLELLYITINLYNDRKKYDLKITQEYYGYIIKMSTLMHSRIRYLDFKLQKDFVSVYSNFVKNEFTNFEIIDKEKKDLEQSIRNLDFDLFLKYCKYKKMILNGGRT